MRAFRAWSALQRKFVLSFLLLLLLPAAAVVGLGVRLIEQDRALESRQFRERRESASDRVVASLEQSLIAIARRLAGPLAGAPIQPGDDAVWVAFEGGGITAYPEGGLLYYPALPPSPEEPAAAFASGEDLEFRARDYAKAAAIFRQLAASSAADVRAGALLRLARNLRKAGSPEEALQRLSHSGPTAASAVSRTASRPGCPPRPRRAARRTVARRGTPQRGTHSASGSASRALAARPRLVLSVHARDQPLARIGVETAAGARGVGGQCGLAAAEAERAAARRLARLRPARSAAGGVFPGPGVAIGSRSNGRSGSGAAIPAEGVVQPAAIQS